MIKRDNFFLQPYTSKEPKVKDKIARSSTRVLTWWVVIYVENLQTQE